MKHSFYLSVLFALICVTPTSAAVVVNISDAELTPGGTGSVDVFAFSTDNDSVAGFSVLLEIVEVTAPLGLEFAPSSFSPVSDRQQRSEQNDANYIFSGDTSEVNFASVRQIDTRELVQSDVSATFSAVGLSTQPVLIGSIELMHTTPNPNVDAGQYQVRLVQNPAQTLFFDGLGMPVDLDPQSFSTANDSQFGSGLVNVSVVAVPEPGSALALAVLGGCVAVARRRQRQDRSPSR